ncbi:MBL fold metallo-hydrolase [Prevotella dentasini]|uniref:MBL fold metallo-hydrolase n=1 Tax=Prevotella dentasini TaxID=589537 RepID=UPI00278C0E46|nr:MBL fold metallo-hydrolase [Prevotella dentasini]
MERAEVPVDSITDLFVTHAHTDHLQGCVWMMRMALQFKHHLHIWSHSKVIRLLSSICRETLPPKEADGIGSIVELHCLESGEHFSVGNIQLTCFDIYSTKEPQFGFQALMPDSKKLCCLGDEPYCEQNAIYAEKCGLAYE